MELTLLLRLLISEAGRFPRAVLLGKVGSCVHLVSHESGIRGVQDRWRDEAVDFSGHKSSQETPFAARGHKCVVQLLSGWCLAFLSPQPPSLQPVGLESKCA